VAEFDRQVVQERVFRRPRARLRHRQVEFGSRRPGDRPHLRPVGRGGHPDRQGPLCRRLGGGGIPPSREVDGHGERLLRQGGRQVQPLDGRVGHRFEPDRLPDARRRRVEDASRVAALFAQRVARVCRVDDPDEQFLLAVAEMRRQIEREVVVPALVAPDLLAVAVHRREPVDGLEVDEESLALTDGPPVGDRERRPVPDELFPASDSRQRRLDREGHEHTLPEGVADRRRLADASRPEPPLSVQRLPPVASQLRPGIAVPDRLRGDVVEPLRRQSRRCRLPLTGRRRRPVVSPGTATGSQRTPRQPGRGDSDPAPQERPPTRRGRASCRSLSPRVAGSVVSRPVRVPGGAVLASHASRCPRSRTHKNPGVRRHCPATVTDTVGTVSRPDPFQPRHRRPIGQLPQRAVHAAFSGPPPAGFSFDTLRPTTLDPIERRRGRSERVEKPVHQ